MQSNTTHSNHMSDSREHAESFARFLFWSAWVFYVASLFLPAVRDEFHARILQGWEVLHATALGFLIAPTLLIYIYANLIFWISIWRWRVQRSQDAVSAFYLLNLFLATAVAWHAIRMVDEVGLGYFCWAISLSLVTIAFSFPRSSTESR